MKFALYNVKGTIQKIIDIDTIEQLIKLKEEYDNELIITDNFFYNTHYTHISEEYKSCKYAIEIYDDYRE